jgi:uncharacterized protein (UPF0210 family)
VYPINSARRTPDLLLNDSKDKWSCRNNCTVKHTSTLKTPVFGYNPHMKIRSITYFIDTGWPLDAKALQRAGVFLRAAQPAFEAAGYEVQTARLATIPFTLMLPSFDTQALVQLAQALEQAAGELGYSYVSLGPALPDDLASYPAIPIALAATRDAFFSGLMTTPGGYVSLPAVRAAAQVMHQAATISPDGFANLRFAALASVPPGSPFFPAAYHVGVSPSFAIATEAADLAVQAFSEAGTLAQARDALQSAMEQHAAALSQVAGRLALEFDAAFGGIDFSLAPFPSQALSLGAAMESLGVPGLGRHGSLAAAAILADTIDQAQFARAGFSGLMLPVLEDAVLAQRAAEGLLTVTDLLLYSAVCGTGLDTVPLPGDASPEQLAALLLDLAALACRLDKPLTARLMPIPGKQAGDPTGFDFAFFANSRVMALRAAPLSGLLVGDEAIGLRRRGIHGGG